MWAKPARDTSFINPSELPPAKGYTQVVVSPMGRTLNLSGQVGMDAYGNIPAPGDFKAQTEQAFKNLDAALKAGGAQFNQVVKLTIYVTDTSQLDILRAIRDRYIDIHHPPASTLVKVSGLFREGLMVEVDAVAVIPDKHRP
ncbi:hypothetical protein WL08_10095 [Burkholderia ubonensis]|nr:hypothetical protein WL08_10095 [Burkholderia ubonensis]